MRSDDDDTSYHDNDVNLRSRQEKAEHYDHILDAFTTLPCSVHTKNTSKLLRTQEPIIRTN